MLLEPKLAATVLIPLKLSLESLPPETMAKVTLSFVSIFLDSTSGFYFFTEVI
jgi:hypothetical protein